MSKIGIGAIGVGARLSLIVSDMLRRHGDVVELRGIADEKGGAIDFATKLFPNYINAYTDHRQLLADEKIDWILIGSKNYLHRDHCIDAFEAGKNVFCEKPLGISVEECEEIRNAHRKSGLLFATGFVLRYAPLYLKIHEIIQSGRLGPIISVEANENLSPDHGGYIMRNWRRFREQAGPHLLEKCSHDIDLLYWMIGTVPQKAASFGGLNIFTPENRPVVDRLSTPEDEPQLFQGWSAWEEVDPFLSEKNTEDNQVVILEYRNGARATFHTNCSAAYAQRRMYVCGLEGTLEADLASGHLRFRRIGRRVLDEMYQFGSEDLHGGADPLMVDDLIRCMETGEYPRASGEEGFVSAITCLAVDEAMRTGKVVDLEPYWKRFGIGELAEPAD